MKGVRDYRSLLSAADLRKGSSFEITDVQAGKIQIRERGTGFFGKTICWLQDQFHLHLSKRALTGSQSTVYKNVLADIQADATVGQNLKNRAVRRLETLQKSGVPLRVRYLRNLARNLDAAGAGEIPGNQYLEVKREGSGPQGSESGMFSISFELVRMEDISDAIDEAVGSAKNFVDDHLKRGVTSQDDASILEGYIADELLSDFTTRVGIKLESAVLAGGIKTRKGDPAARRLELDNIFQEAITELRRDRIEMCEDGARTYGMVTGVTNRGIENFAATVDGILDEQGKKCKTPLSTDDLFALRDDWKARVRAEVTAQDGEARPEFSDIVDGQMREVCGDFIRKHPDKVEPTPESTVADDSDNFMNS